MKPQFGQGLAHGHAFGTKAICCSAALTSGRASSCPALNCIALATALDPDESCTITKTL